MIHTHQQRFHTSDFMVDLLEALVEAVCKLVHSDEWILQRITGCHPLIDIQVKHLPQYADKVLTVLDFCLVVFLRQMTDWPHLDHNKSQTSDKCLYSKAQAHRFVTFIMSSMELNLIVGPAERPYSNGVYREIILN